MKEIINKPPLHLLSTEQIPLASKRLSGAQLSWYNADSEERYKLAPHPSFGPKDIVYKFNSYGYRCPEFEFDESGRTLSVVSIGASEVIGTGLAIEHTFSHLFSQLLEAHLDRPVVNWNLGVGGASADYIARILASALPVLKPDIVLLVFPYYGRREHINFQGRAYSFNSLSAKARLKEANLNPEKANQLEANLVLSSDYNDQLNFYKNYQFCEHLCETYKTSWLFSAFKMGYFQQIQHLISSDHFVTPGLDDIKGRYQHDPIMGLARDMGHPGIVPHKEMAANFFERLKTLYFERLGFA